MNINTEQTKHHSPIVVGQIIESQNCKFKLAFIEVLKDRNPKYFLTLTFSPKIGEKRIKALLDEFWHELNTRILKNRYKSSSDFLDAIAVREKGDMKSKKGHAKLTDESHFHIVFKDIDNRLGDLEWFTNHVQKSLDFVNRKQFDLPTDNQLKAVLEEEKCPYRKIQIQDYFDSKKYRFVPQLRDFDLQAFDPSSEWLEIYLTKNFLRSSYSLHEKIDSIIPSSHHGFDYLVVEGQ